MWYRGTIAAPFAGLMILALVLSAAHADITVRDRVITNSATTGHLLPWGSGRMTSFGELSAFLYRTESSGDWLYIQDGSGDASHSPLPDHFDMNERANAEYVLTSPTDLWIWSGISGRAALRHYRLTASASSRLPDEAVRDSITSVGNKDTRPGALLRLTSGGVLGVWHQFSQHQDRHLDIGLIYVSPDGVSMTYYPISVPGKEGTPVAARWAIVQHPVDRSIWAFFKRDSYHEISTLHLTETAQGIRLDWIKQDFIGRKDEGHEPEGEFPYLAAVADYGHNTIVLAYQNNRYQLMYVTDGDGNLMNGSCGQSAPNRMEPYFFAKRSRVSIMLIAADGRKTVLDFPDFVERTQEFGLSVTDRLWIIYRRIGCETSNYELLQRRGQVILRSRDGQWNEPLILGGLDIDKDYNSASLFYSPDQPHFLMRLDDGLLHFFEAKPNP